MLQETAIFVLSLFFLVKASDIFVKSAARAAEKLGISEFVIGLTLVALGTSVPELAAGIYASIRDSTGLVVGNVIGSNLANIGIVIGTCALIASIKTKEEMLIRDGYIMMFITTVFFLMMLWGRIGRLSSAVLFLLYLSYLVFVLETRAKTRDEYHFRSFIPYFFRFGYIAAIHRRIIHEIQGAKDMRKARIHDFFEEESHIDLLFVIASGIVIVLSAKYFVTEALFFARAFHVPEAFIGVTIVAFGTILPELSVSIVAVRKGFGNLAVGNIIGSNIANIGLVAGTAGMITPLFISTFSMVILGPVLLLLTAMLLLFIKSRWRIHRAEGAIFVATYAVFAVVLFIMR